MKISSYKHIMSISKYSSDYIYSEVQSGNIKGMNSLPEVMSIDSDDYIRIYYHLIRGEGRPILEIIINVKISRSLDKIKKLL